MDGADHPDHYPRPAEVLGAVGLLGLLKHASRDAFTPEGVPALNEHDLAVLHAANRLAGDQERNDRDAVAELLRVAGRHPKRLRKAEIASRRFGHYLESAVANRAQRLLKAAVTGEAVTEPSAADRHRFEVVASFRALPPDRAWEQLVAAVPELSAVADGQAGAFDLPAEFLDKTLPPEQRVATAREVSARFKAVGSRLDELLGPRSGQLDPLLASTYARHFAFDYLRRRPEPPP